MSILEKIIEHKKLEIAALDAQALRRAANSAPAPRDFLAAISLSLWERASGVRGRRFGTQPKPDR